MKVNETLNRIVKSLNEAKSEVDEIYNNYKRQTSMLPDGTNICGWVKHTLAGDVMWIKNGKGVSSVTVEVGSKKINKFLSAQTV